MIRWCRSSSREGSRVRRGLEPIASTGERAGTCPAKLVAGRFHIASLSTIGDGGRGGRANFAAVGAAS